MKIVCYADDATNTAHLQNSSRKRQHEDLHEKPKSKDLLRCKLAVDNTTIGQVTSFNYLGSGSYNEEVRQEANTAAVISGHLKQTIWKNKHLSIRRTR
jgi:hypothetical protein